MKRGAHSTVVIGAAGPPVSRPALSSLRVPSRCGVPGRRYPAGATGPGAKAGRRCLDRTPEWDYASQHATGQEGPLGAFRASQVPLGVFIDL